MKRKASTGLLLIAFALLQGCGPATGDVKGKVYLGDKPLVLGQVTFLASDAKAYGSGISDDGSYHIKGIPVGPAGIVVVSPFPNKGQPMVIPGKDMKPGPNEKVKKELGNPRWFEIPRAYGDATRPLLKHTITAGDNQHDIKLEPEPK